MTVLRGKWILATLTCLMLVALLPMGVMTQTVQASPEYLFTLHLTVPYLETCYRHDIAASIRAELAKIGINVELEFVEGSVHWDITLSENYYKTWDEGGWDMDVDYWGFFPIDLIWFEGMYRSDAAPPTGWNYFGWNNTGADNLLRASLSTVDPELRKEYIWGWQEEFMHDPPHVCLFYWLRYDVIASDIEGYDSVSWWWSGSGIRRSGTTPEDYVTATWGSADDLGPLNPGMFGLTLASETFAAQTFEMLMKPVFDPITGGAKAVPQLARQYPVYSPDGKTVTVYLRNDVYWHDWTNPETGVSYINEKLTAEDVKFTFDGVLDKETQSIGYGDFAPVIESVEIKDDYTVVFHLKEPFAAFDALLANCYGGYILPEHVLRDVPHSKWRSHWTNSETPMPGTGAFKFVRWVRDEFWELEANKNYYLGEPYIDRVINVVITDPAAGLIAIQTHQIDFGDCWEATMEQIENMKNDPTLNVVWNRWPYLEVVSFNLHHPILSNRYVRQAIAHAIPYEHIITDILPGWAMGGIRASAPVFPLHGYLYNSELKPYEYDLAKAKRYLDMWKYSQVNSDYTLGPVGDGDFSGFVEMADFVVWADRIVEGQLTPGTWPFVSGRPIDPDYDNTGYVEMADFYRWRENIGEYYPFYGAR